MHHIRQNKYVNILLINKHSAFRPEKWLIQLWILPDSILLDMAKVVKAFKSSRSSCSAPFNWLWSITRTFKLNRFTGLWNICPDNLLTDNLRWENEMHPVINCLGITPEILYYYWTNPTSLRMKSSQMKQEFHQLVHFLMH